MVDDMDNYLLPVTFIKAWRQFIKDPLHISPPVLSNKELLCPHDKLHLDLSYAPDLSSELVLALLPNAWEKITAR